MKTKREIPENWKSVWRKDMQFFYDYLPTKYMANKNEWSIRELIWHFKDGDNEKVTSKVAAIIAKQIRKQYADKAKDMLFVCVPASNEEKNRQRYEHFCEEVCALSGIRNGYQAIKVEGNRLAIHEAKDGKHIKNTQIITFDAEALKGQKVVVFDDIITNGHTYARFVVALEAQGAEVQSGYFLGRTLMR